ncbi:ubiquinol-cytochrome C chaperone [Hyphomicrobium methylovorum]|nr:ubiquinol-cytochrome C chaperone [Hyphomicrobium methylovorum]
MLQWFRRRAETTQRASELYGAVVAAARHPAFYARMGVPDTPEGRFEIVALHLFFALETLRAGGVVDQRLSQRLVEGFVTDMDDCMREMGVGDLSVGKKVKRAAAAFYERAKDYRRGLSFAGCHDLRESLVRHVFGDKPEAPADPDALAAYVRSASVALGNEAFEAFAARGGFGDLLSGTRAS